MATSRLRGLFVPQSIEALIMFKKKKKAKTMAKRRRTRTVNTSMILAPRSASPARRRSTRSIVVAGRARRKSSGVSSSRATAGTVVGGAIIGYLDGAGKLDILPEVMGSRMITLGLLGYAAQKFSKNASIKAAGISAMTVASFDLGRGIGATGQLPKTTK